MALLTLRTRRSVDTRICRGASTSPGDYSSANAQRDGPCRGIVRHRHIKNRLAAAVAYTIPSSIERRCPAIVGGAERTTPRMGAMMLKQLQWRLWTAAMLLAAALLFSGCKPKNNNANSNPPNPQNPQVPNDDQHIVVNFSYDSAKQAWLSDVTQKFNQANNKIGNGKIIYVNAVATGSGECIDDLIAGDFSRTSPARPGGVHPDGQRPMAAGSPRPGPDRRHQATGAVSGGHRHVGADGQGTGAGALSPSAGATCWR